jgi:hypothetical protein
MLLKSGIHQNRAFISRSPVATSHRQLHQNLPHSFQVGYLLLNVPDLYFRLFSHLIAVGFLTHSQF